MTTVEYTYEITRVDPAAKAMDITYTSPVYGSLVVGARMPWEGESLEDIVRMFSPVRYWLEKSTPVAEVPAGASGQLAHTIDSQRSAPREVSKLALVRTMRDVDYGDVTLWDAAKAQLALADEATQEDWQVASVIREDDPVFVAMATTLYGAEAQAQIKAIFDAAGG